MKFLKNFFNIKNFIFLSSFFLLFSCLSVNAKADFRFLDDAATREMFENGDSYEDIYYSLLNDHSDDWIRENYYDESYTFPYAYDYHYSDSDGSINDYSQLSDRLSEYEIRIDNLEESYSRLLAEKNLVDLQNQNLSSKMDVLIVLLNEHFNKYDDLLISEDTNYFTSTLTLFENLYHCSSDHFRSSELIRKYLSKDTESFDYEADEVTLDSLINDLSDNINESLTVTNQKTLESLNETLLTTNQFLANTSVALIVIIALGLALFVGFILYKIINRNVV